MTPRRPSKPIRPLRASAATSDERAVATLLSLVPDPTPDRQFLERAWRGLDLRRRQRPPAWRWAAAAGTALAAAALAAWLALHPARAEMLVIEGTVSTGAAGTSWVPAQPGEPLRAGAIVETVGDSRSLLRLAGITSVLSDSGTELELESLGRDTMLHLSRGAVTLRVTKRPSGQSFAVRAGSYTVIVLGTLFTVSRSTDGQVEVSVAEGVVRVSGMGGGWRVTAGECWTSDSASQRSPYQASDRLAPLMEAALGPDSDGQLPQLLHALRRERMSEHQVSSQTSVVPTETKGAHSLPAIADVSKGTSDAPQSVVPPREKARPRASVRTQTPERLAVAEHPVPAEPAPIAEPVAPVVPISAPKPTATAAPTYEHDLYAEAVILERQGDHRQASAKLEAALSSKSGPRDLELYHLALLRQRHLNDPRGALDALLSYRKGFPAGALRQEVDLSIIETRLALGQTDEVLAESAYFLSRYAKSERADEMRFMRGDLLRRRGDCAGALAEYRAVQREPLLDDSLYYSAYCLRELGETDAAARGLRKYLGRFPAGKHVRAAREALGDE
jgi:TolA-binding protein